jgi:hypothetical protein
MKVFAWVGGVAVVAGLVVLAVAGSRGATAILVTGVALVGMIALGSSMGGRHTANTPPVGVGGDPGAGDGAGSEGGGQDGAEPGGRDGEDGAGAADGGTLTR